MEKIKLARGRPKKPDSEKVDHIHLSLPRLEANWVRENGYSSIILKLVRKEMASREEGANYGPNKKIKRRKCNHV